MSENLLDVYNVSISFIQYVKGLNQKNLKVISDLSLSIDEGEIVAVLGSSGSGKSLLAHAILGILPDNALLNGEMYYKGELLNPESKERLRGDDIALIPQSVNFLDPLMKISEQVIGECDSEEEEKELKAKQRKIFEKYNLGEEVDDMYPFQLSGGMARRVLVSTALLSNPKLVIADEPTPGLDEAALEETLNYLRDMANNNVGILLITHDINAALKVADKIAIFYAGYVIEIANIDDFKNNGENLLHPYTKALYHALPDVDFKLTEGHQPLRDEINDYCPYLDHCPHCVDKCDSEIPKLVKHGDKYIRCFKYTE
ncbi:MAG: ABC transporter ATP-binding protein [archaeon]|nr:ABC transporter ATP-binding protein [archaeon]